MSSVLRALGLSLLLNLFASTTAFAAEAPRVKLETSMGDIVLTLDADKAPKSVANFLDYVKRGYYSGMVFHRVIPGFLIQGGGFDAKLKRKPVRPSISNESKNGLQNLPGTIAMGRAADPNSANSEFFINLQHNVELDYPSFDGWGYAVFGQVSEGLDVVEKIASVPTGSSGKFPRDVPKTPVIINKAVLLSPAPNTPPEESRQP